MKAYTDLEQSKKLAGILSLDSADMCYDWFVIGKEYSSIPQCRKFIDDELPCWSLAALLEILTYPLLQKNMEGKWLIHDWTGAFPKMKKGYNSSIDACVAMIEKLHEQKLL